MSATAEKKIVKARANLVMAHPFFGALALRLKFKANPGLKSFTASDGTCIEYNPQKIDDISMTQVQGAIAQAVMHLGFLHHTRRGAREFGKWQKACDYSVNNILEEAGFDLPNKDLLNAVYRGMTAEHIYTVIPDNDDKDPNGSGGGSGSGGSQGDGNSNDGEDPNGSGGGSGGGSDSGGSQGDGNSDVNDSPNSQNRGGSPSQQAAEEADWKTAMAQAAHVAKQQGKLPASLERMMEELFEPVLPWRNILRRFMTERAQDDFSWKRGNRRFVAQGLYLPSRESEGSGEMVAIIDTSGSIGQKELDEFGSEIAGIHKDVRPSKLYIIYCDADIAHVDEFGPEDELHFKIRGGGGTDFRPPFHWLEERQILPKCAVYLTDGYGPFPDEQPFPVLWCINNHDVVPPNGEHLVLEV